MRPFGLINMGVLPLLLEAMAPAYAQREPREQEARRPPQEQEAKLGRHPQEAQPERQGRPQPARGQEERQHPREARPEKQPQQAMPARQEPPGRARGLQERQRQSEAKGQHERQQQQQRQQQQIQRQQAQPRELQRPHQAIRPSQQEQRGRQGDQRAVWQEHRAKSWRTEHRTWQERGGYNGYRIPEDRYRSHFGPSHAFRIYSYPLVVFGGYPRFQFGGFWFSVVDPWPEYWSDSWYDDDDVYIDYAGDGYYLYNRRYPGDRITISVHVN